MTNDFKVTVLMAIFNGEKTIDRCLKSLLDQTYQNFKIICVNDNSTDKTENILEKWQKKFGNEKFILIKNTINLGLTKSLNKGLLIISTPYTARIDADDWWNKNKLEIQLNFLENNSNYGVVGCNYKNIKHSKEINITLPEKNEIIKKNIIKRNPFAHSCVIFRTELIKKIGSYDEGIKYGQDYDLWLRAYPHTKFYNIQKFLCYRTAESEISIKKQRSQMIQGIKTQLKYIKKYNLPLKNYPYIFELLILIITPNFIKSIKRKIF